MFNIVVLKISGLEALLQLTQFLSLGTSEQNIQIRKKSGMNIVLLKMSTCIALKENLHDILVAFIQELSIAIYLIKYI